MSVPGWAEPVARKPVTVLAVCAAVLVPVAWRLGPVPSLPAFCYLVATGVVLAFVDGASKRLPDAVTLPSYAVGVLSLGLAAPFTDRGGARFTHALIGMAALFLLYAVQWFVAPGHIGLGDVKLAGVLGLYLGWLGLPAWVGGTCAGYVLAALYAAGLLLSRRATLKSELPFGPFMLAGALAAVLAYG